MKSEPEVAKVRELVLRHGWNSTCYQIVNPGIRWWFSSSCDSVIGYVLRNRVRVVAGAPVCTRGELDRVIGEWEASEGTRVCYFGAEGRMGEVTAGNAQYSSVVLGAQPVWDPARWAEVVHSDRSLRAQFARARNKGVSIREWTAEEAETSAALRQRLQEWLQTRGLPTMHFLVEPDTLDMMVDRRVFVAERGGAPVGFLVLSPIPERNGWLTEQFVRGFGAPNGTVELMMDVAVTTIAEEGAEFLTMGIVPLSQHALQDEHRNPLWLRFIAKWVRAHGRRFYNFDGLDWFKSKFHPQEWEPILAISNERRFSFRTLCAIAAAFSDGPVIWALLRGMGRAVRQEWSWFYESHLRPGRGARAGGVARKT